MSADLLRRAAKVLRSHVADLPVRIQDDWTQDSSDVVTKVGYDVGRMTHYEGAEVAYYVVLMHPPVAVALAAFLEQHAAAILDFALHFAEGTERVDDQTETDEAAVALACAILREEVTP